jgi:hypothetical protein
MGRDRLVAAGLAGGSLGILFGYWASKTGQAMLPFKIWLTNPSWGGSSAVLFAGLGATAMVSITYLIDHNSK